MGRLGNTNNLSHRVALLPFDLERHQLRRPLASFANIRCLFDGAFWHLTDLLSRTICHSITPLSREWLAHEPSPRCGIAKAATFPMLAGATA